MVTIHWHNETITGDIAVRGDNYIALYNNEYKEVSRIVNIRGPEWDYISIAGGEWSSPDIIPTEPERLQADIDFLTMENESLTEQNEQQQADIDYLLMITEEE